MAGDDLPLFVWKPPCVVLAFPVDRQASKVRDVATKLSTKTTERHAEQYTGQVTDALVRRLQRIGLSDDAIDEQVGRFWSRVHLEVLRITYSNPRGAA